MTEAGQHWDTNLYDTAHSYVWRYGEGVLGILEAQPGERILDLGAGTGHLTARIAEAGATVIGLDASADMVAQAKQLYPNIDFIHADAAEFRFDEPFDAVFSNATLHWVKKSEEAVESISAALKLLRFPAHTQPCSPAEAYSPPKPRVWPRICGAFGRKRGAHKPALGRAMRHTGRGPRYGS